MADFVFNTAADRLGYLATLPAANDGFVAVLVDFAGLEADEALRDHDTLAALLAGTTNENTSTSYARQALTGVTRTVVDASNWVDIDAANPTWALIGGASNVRIGAIVICYDPDTTGGTDADLIPCVKLDWDVTPNGDSLTADFPAGGFARVAA